MFGQGVIPISSKQVQHIGKFVLRGEHQKNKASLHIIFTDNKQITDLNQWFLHKEYPTDVLVFPLDENDVWGEIYVNQEKAREHAEIYHVSVDEELARLIIHGILHLIGYDDCNKDMSDRMRERETYYLAKLL